MWVNRHQNFGASNGQVAMSALGFGCAYPTAVIAFCPSCQRPALLWASYDCAFSSPCFHVVLWPLGLYRVMRTRCLRWPHSAPLSRA